MAGKVGFIGLGAMGRPMALNLAKAGQAGGARHRPAKTAAVRTQGAEVAGHGRSGGPRPWTAPS